MLGGSWWRAATRLGAALGACALSLTLAACSGSDPRPSSTSAPSSATTAGVPATAAWPVPDWEVVEPEAAGVDPERLELLAEQAEASGSNCLVVTRGGRLVGEWYWNGWDEGSTQGVFSATKSASAALVGIAEGDGLLDLDDPASTWITEWRGTDSETVTVRNLLSNDSGRHWDFATDYRDMAVAARDKTGFAIGLDQQHPPGEHWEYNNSAIQTLDAVLKRATGGDVADFAEERLFGPIGSEAHMSHDPEGNTIMYSDMVTSCRDLARFGLLWLRGGEWNGEQVVPADFVADSVEQSQELNKAYGYLWWRSLEGSETATRPNGQRVEAQRDALRGFAALGLGDQVAAVYPDEDLVITRIASVNVPAGSPEFGFAAISAGAFGLVVDGSDMQAG
jgi:CubicO group peptidase (beta-lactamase class C family)